jgi:hypothetical protein
MITPPESQYWAAIDALPEPLRAQLISSATATTLEALYTKANIPLNIQESVSALVGFMLTGFLPVRFFLKEVQEIPQINASVISQIAQDIRREILAPVAHDLAALQPQAEQNYATALREAGSTPAQQPVSNTSVQQGPPLPPKPQFPQAPPAPPQ